LEEAAEACYVEYTAQKVQKEAKAKARKKEEKKKKLEYL